MKAIYNGIVIAESDRTEMVEGNHYFPRDSVDMQVLAESSTPYTCPWKGRAEYFHLEIDGERVDDIAWSYPDPKPAAQAIGGHVAFDARKGVKIAE